ncbi:MAG: HepT-like ribonuclease domain-containing protein [Coriobacteriia bacterium]
MCGRREPLLYINDMVEAAERIVDVCEGVPDDRIMRDANRSDIILWRLTVLGEAAKNVPAEVRTAHPGIAWHEAARLRDRVVHHYEGIDAAQIAAVVCTDLPQLLTALRPLQAKLLGEWQVRQDRLGGVADW